MSSTGNDRVMRSTTAASSSADDAAASSESSGTPALAANGGAGHASDAIGGSDSALHSDDRSGRDGQ
jgi:hypothetical protein